MRPVPIKSIEQQVLRGLCRGFGIVLSTGLVRAQREISALDARISGLDRALKARCAGDTAASTG